MKSGILIVDDERDMAKLIKRILESEIDTNVTMAFSAGTALNILEHEKFDLMLCDIKMPEMDGFELLAYAREHYPDLTIVMITAFGSIDIAVKAIKQGAYDFISKPFEQDEIIFKVKKALERSLLLKENKRLSKERDGSFAKLTGESPAMQKVYNKIAMVAESDITVLITGESGTGKDLTAQSIHSMSKRKNAPFVIVNCPTVPEHILESELFGYKKGAFTNAVGNKKGLFQEADKGTIFLDEIGDIGPVIQTKLLRVLQEKEIKPLGDTKSVKIDVRIIASTNRNLSKKIKDGEFREDFFYRLNVITIELPALRDRMADVPMIAEHLVAKHCKNLKKPVKKISSQLMKMLMDYSWPGNVRELENTLIQGIIYSESDTIRCSDISFNKKKSPAVTPVQALSDSSSFNKLPYKEAKEKILKEFNHNYINAALSLTNGNITRAAKLCSMERQALQQIMKRFSIKADKFR